MKLIASKNSRFLCVGAEISAHQKILENGKLKPKVLSASQNTTFAWQKIAYFFRKYPFLRKTYSNYLYCGHILWKTDKN